MNDQIEWIVLDLGGVLVELGDPAETFSVDGGRDAFFESWLQSDAVREHEQGRCSFDEFARRVVADLQLSYSPEEFMRRFDDWPVDFYNGTLTLLQSLRQSKRVGVLSNTNARHWDLTEFGPTLERETDLCLLSHRNGLLKPDDDAFENMLQQTRCAADRLLFIDDNQVNVRAATRLGIVAERAVGDADLRQVLQKYRLIS